MILFFTNNTNYFPAVEAKNVLPDTDIQKLEWLFGCAKLINSDKLTGYFKGPRREMVTPWSTNAVEITQNMGIEGITRIEEFYRVENENAPFDQMLAS
jgi:phosphoribosylformylglycinamidine synthase